MNWFKRAAVTRDSTHADIAHLFAEKAQLLIDHAELVIKHDELALKVQKLEERLAAQEKACFDRHVNGEHKMDRLRQDIHQLKGIR